MRRWEQNAVFETSECICLVKRINGVVAQKTIESELVRCGECKHNYNTAINHGKMQPRCDFTDWKLTENDFCSRGEREGE